MMPQIVFNDMSPEQAAIGMEHTSHSSTSVFATPSTIEPWANGIPCAYIFCTDDNALPFPTQKQMAEQLGTEPLTWRLTAGHCPFFSIPDQLLEVVQKAADGMS